MSEARALHPDVPTVDHPNLAAALVAAQKEMPAVEKDGTNPHFKSSFTTLGRLIATVRPVLNRHGIAVIQMPSRDEQGKPTLVTRLVHSSGESTEETMPLILAKQDAQALGSALTYAKRYALAAALAIADQEDDDGNAAVNEAVGALPASKEQSDVLSNALNWLLPDPIAAAAAWDRIEERCGGAITAPAALAVIAAIAAKRDLESQEPKQSSDAGSGDPAGAMPAPDPDRAPAAGIEDEMPADTEGLG